MPVAFLALFFAWPVLAIVLRGLAEDGSVVDVWRRRSTGDVLWFTAGQAALSTLVTLAIGLPAAWATARTALPGRRVVRVLVLVPFVLPTLVVGAAVEALFERFGARTGSLTAIVVAHVVFNVAVVVRIVGGHWSLLDPRVEEVAHAREEGVVFHMLQNAVRILGDEQDRVTGMECLRYELGEPDASGRRSPLPIPGSEFLMAVDTVIVAIGNGSNPLISQTTEGLAVNKWGNIIVDETGKSSIDGIYAGGDIVLGAATVILAMGEGRRAAAAINAYLADKV